MWILVLVRRRDTVTVVSDDGETPTFATKDAALDATFTLPPPLWQSVPWEVPSGTILTAPTPFHCQMTFSMAQIEAQGKGRPA